jgi:hypothetical protein
MGRASSVHKIPVIVGILADDQGPHDEIPMYAGTRLAAGPPQSEPAGHRADRSHRPER